MSAFKDKNRIYFITGGGTGGHIYPAIAVADDLLKKESTGKIYYIGNPDNPEAQLTSNKDYTFLPVITSGMPRKFDIEFIKWALKMLKAILKCCQYIWKYKPDVIFGTGGYVSAPTLMAGRIMKVPYILHDCDAQPGLVTQAFAPQAKSISVAFEAAKLKLEGHNPEENNKDYKPDYRIIVNGNPIREDFKTLTKEKARQNLNLENKLTLCIMGGSQGAKTINSAAVEILNKLSNNLDLQVIFQTGKKNYDEVIDSLKEIYPAYKDDKNLIIKPYFDNMAEVLKASDIAVSRSGSLSISELCACAVATIFIPYPHAAANHQHKNARFLTKRNAGILLPDKMTTPKALYKKIKKLISNQEELQQMQQAAFSLAKPDAVTKIANLLEKI